MADIILDCPACKQAVQADDEWGGQQIECPICKAPMIVPQAQGSPAQVEARSIGKQLVNVPGETNLSAVSIQVPRPTSGRGIPIRNLQQSQAKRKSPVVRYLLSGVVIVAVLASGWVAWPYIRPHIPFLNKAGGESAAAPPTTTDKAADTSAQETAPPPPKEVPMTAPVYTLDVAQAKISEGKVNGSVAGTNFVPEAVRLDTVAGGYVLSMRQGAGPTPDRGLRVNLQLKPTDSPTGHTWTVSQDMKGTPISRVTKVWKTNPKYAAQEKPFFTGFALKLEFGQFTVSNTLPGKIYLALPDQEETVVGGVFNAATTLAGAQETGAQQPEIQNPQTDAQRAEFEKRYGVRRKP